ncbi:hypothetical protein DACRYDRAFT_91195 [Dacryopinax primogenitus]|uniref:Uncharacterized protein n=1 Tax=Dacryopinax primogenitus (strain DJM 731) TaxID=1858805 RepID=M5G399_DACPD|nr:uncharacterized protein DACRYDRAFT_91195 [Dacryopinax primogenitus]EJT98227.1 hypothetical protein DACRYDRAFT_91195 [Dacryopinax primogenitus]
MTESHMGCLSPALLIQVAYTKQKGLDEQYRLPLKCFGVMLLAWRQQHPELASSRVAQGACAHVDRLRHHTCITQAALPHQESLTPDSGVPIKSTAYTQDLMEPVSIPVTTPADHVDSRHCTCITEDSKLAGACLRGSQSNSTLAYSASNGYVSPPNSPQTAISHSNHTAAAVPGSLVMMASTECPAHAPSLGTICRSGTLANCSEDDLPPAYHGTSHPLNSSSLLDAHPASDDKAVPLYCHHEVLPPCYMPPHKQLKLPLNLSHSSSPMPSTSSSLPPLPHLVALDKATL